MLLVSALAVAACASAPVPCTVAEPAFAPPAGNAPDYDALDTYVRAAMRDWHVPGLALAIVAGDSVAFARGFGVRRVDAPGDVDVHTSFGLLSTTKTFTAAALALLADEGVLSLDDPVVRHLPDFRVDDDRITAALRIRDLLSHATGYEENHRLWYKQDGTTRDVAARSGELRAIAPPRTAFHYNNLMYVVAGEVVEAASGMRWADFVRERLLVPLGMHDSAMNPPAGEAGGNTSSPHARRVFYRYGAIRPIPYFQLTNIGPAGSMQSSVHDMTAWLRLHLNGGIVDGRRLLGDDAIRALQVPHVPLPSLSDPRIGGDGAYRPLCGVAGASSFGYALGWFTLDFRGHRAVTHGGGINGQRAAVGLLPDLGVGVVILSNMHGTEISLALMYHVFDLFLDAPPRDWSAEYMRAAGR